jgi:superfamily II DNA or RNA helicase
VAKFTLYIRATSIKITPGIEASVPLDPLIEMLTYEDEFAEQTKTLGYIYDEADDAIYFHKGVDINYVVKLLGECKVVNQMYDKYLPMKFEYEEIVGPRDDDQRDVINFIAGLKHFAENRNARQLFLVKKPGFGKTYCSGVGMCLWKTKTLIITHRDDLRTQWLNSLYNMSGMSSREVHEITSSEELYDIATGKFDAKYDVYLITHATFRAGMKRIGSMILAQNITKNLGIGLKIIDEAHLEFRDTILMDCVFNVYRNLYLTATDGRSQKEENHIFRHVFSNAVYYKPSAFLNDNLPKKWVNYITMAVNTHVLPNIYKYRIAGGKGMNPASYGKWVIKNDKKNTHFKCCTELVRSMYMEDSHAKVIIFMPLIELCQDCAFWINKHLSRDKTFPYDLTIRTINSSNSKRENELNKRADVIVTTIASAGTGTDIPGITDIICCSPFVSKITAEQTFGRIRYIPKQCHYYDIYDTSVQMDKFWLRSRYKKFKELAKSVQHLSWSEDEQ